MQLAAPFFLTLALSGGSDDPAPRQEGPRRIITDRQSPVILPLPKDEQSFHFVIFGDRTGGPPEGIEVLRAAVADANLLGPDLVMTVGDLVEGYNQRPQWLLQMEEFKSSMAALEMPWFPVAGNHDIYWRGDGRPAQEHEGDYETHFGPLWYAFEHKGCWFFALYTDEADPQTGVRDFNRPASQRMSPEQFAWLDRTLEQAKGARHIFVFVHHPRWIAGRYGEDWERVHQRLAKNGNVSAVFGGHIHRMRYDGQRDGVEYFTLATVGGVQEGHAARAGYLHQYHLVTVRDEGLSIAAYPVGAVLDPRQITGAVSEQVELLAQRLDPCFTSVPRIDSEGSLTGALGLEISNPTRFPIEIRLSFDAPDLEWFLMPDHLHAELAPETTQRLELAVHRSFMGRGTLLALPRGQLEVDLLTESARFPLPARALSMPLPPGAGIAAWLPEAEPMVLQLDGKDDCARVNDRDFELPDGPFTLECWLRAQEFGARQGLISKAESSEFALFADRGLPSFSVHLDGAYVVVKAPEPLPTERWVHVAGVFDGEALKLYVNGKLVATEPGHGKRTRNTLPLIIGGDVSARGRLDSPFFGSIDLVRLTPAALYQSDFEPYRNPGHLGSPVLTLNFDQGLEDCTPDFSASGAHAELCGGARLAPGQP